jgi:ribosome biogenesis GTPase
MFALAGGGYLIDSPGIKELGLTGFDREELSHYFPEMRKRMTDCRFSNCTHVHEPGCAVQAALEKGEIAMSRYQSYRSMLADIDEAEKY